MNKLLIYNDRQRKSNRQIFLTALLTIAFLFSFNSVRASSLGIGDSNLPKLTPKTVVQYINNNTFMANGSQYWGGLLNSNLSSYIPYIGANKNVNLGANNL